MNDLRILIDAGINMGSSIKNINDELKALAAHPSLKPLNLKVDIDQSFVKSMNEFVAATKVLNTALEQQQKVVNESIKTTKLLDGTVEKVTQKQLANGSIITQTTKKINEETKAYSEQKKTLQQLEKELDGYTLARTRANKNKLGEINSTTNTYKNQAGQQVSVNVDNEGNVKNYSQITDYLKQQQDALQKEQALNKQREQAAQQEYATRKALGDKNLKDEEQRNQQFVNQLKARFAEEQKIARDRDALDKAHSAAITENLSRQKAVADMEAKISSAKTKFSGNASAVAELNALNTQLGNVSKVSNYKNALIELQTKLVQITSQAKLAGNEAKTLGERFANAASKVALWTGATSSIYMTIRALKDMTNVIIQVDSQMTQLKRVMDASTDFEGMLSRSIQLANELGRSITEVNENAIGFARMGFDENDTMYLAKTSTLLQNISELTPQESVDTLTAAMTIFNVEAGKSVEIANKLNEIDNNFAVTTQNLALSMTRAGASANTFGVSMEELLGHTTAIATATRESGSVIGNALKSIYSRITTMDKSEEVLAAAGVSMKDLNGETRGVADIMAELASKWNGLSKETQQSTAVNLAGRYQLTRFLAVMQNFPIAISATEAAMNSQGSALRENEKYMQSLEARIQKMKTAWETLSIAFGEAVISDTIITLTSLFASMLNGVAVLVDKAGALPVVLGAIGIGIAILRPKLAALIWDFTKTNITMLATAPAATAASLGMKTLAGAMNIARGAVTALKFALKALLASTIIGGAFVLLGSALEWIVGKFSDATTATEDFSDKTEELNQKQYDLSNLKALSKEYDELSKKTELSFEEKSRLAQIESELSSKYNVTTTSVDGQTKSIQENNEAIQTQIGLKEEELKAARLAAELDYNANAEKIERDIDKQKQALKEREVAYDAALKAYKDNQDEWAKVDPTDSYANMLAESKNKQLASTLKEETDLLAQSKTEFQTTLNAKALAFKGAGQSFVDEQESNNVEIKGLTRGFLDIYANAAAESGVSANQFKKNLSDVFRSIQGKDIASAEEGMKLLKDMPGVLNLTSTSYKDMMSILSQYTYAPVVEGVESADDALNSFNLTLDETVERTDEMSLKISETAKFVDETKKEIDVLNTAQSELADGNRLSTDTIKKMNEKYEDFIKVTGLSKEAIKKYVQAKKEERISVVNDEIKKTKTTIDETRKRIKAYELEMEAWERRRKAEASSKISELNSQLEAGLISEQEAEKLFGAYRRNQQGVDSKGNVINNSTIMDNYAMEKVALKDLLTDLSLLESARSDLTTAAEDSGKKTKESTKSNKENADSVKEVIDVETEWQKKMRESQRLLEKIINDRYKFKKSSAEYRKSLMEENKERQKQIDLSKEGLKNPNQLVSSKVTTTTTTGTSSSASSSDTSSASTSSSGSGTKLDTLLSNALGLQGQFTYKQVSGKFKGTYDQFVQGAISDCSQFVQEMFDEFLGINLPRTAAEQSKQGTAVAKKDLQKGDLVFFETIEGKNASHVGIYTGNGKFIQMGNSGLKEQDLNNSYWGPKYRSARRIDGVGASTVDSIATNGGKTTTTQKSGNVTTKTEAPSAKEIADAVQEQKENIATQEREMYAARIEFIESLSAVYEEAAEIIDDKISKSQSKQSNYGESSADWRKEEMSQISYLEQKNKKLAEQRSMLEKEVKNKQITSGEFDRLMAQNEVEQAQIDSEIASKRNNVYESQRKAYEEQAKADDDAIALSEAKLKLMTEGSVEYNKELRSQLPILEHKQTVTKGEIEYTERLLKSGRLNAVQIEDNTNKLKELNLQLLDTNSAMKDVNDRLKELRESAADNIIDEYKKVIEQQRDLELEALDQLREKEDKRHEEAIKNIDEEQKRFEDYISARLKAFDRENADVDYTEELQSKMDERQKVQDKLNTYALDGTMEGKAKRKELEDQLATIDEEIRKFQRDRERELIKQGLQDQLDDHKEYNDELKDEEDKLHDDTLDNIDEEKKKTERKYKDILDNQKYFYDLKQGLMSNDAIVVTATLGTIGREYDKLFATIKEHTFETSQEMQNMVYDFQKAMESLNKYSVGDYSSPGSDSSNGSNGNGSSTGTIKGTTAARVAWTEYLSNKQSAESIKEEMKNLDKSSAQYKNLTQQFDALKAKNDQLRSVYGFPDGSFKDLVNQKIFSAKTGGMTPSDVPDEGQYILAHKKELILDESDTSNILKVVDVVRGITDKIKSGLNFAGLMPKTTTAPSSNDNSVRIDKVEIYANDKDTGTSLLNKFSSALNSKMKARTI